MKHREAVGAVIRYEGKILCVQKGLGKNEYDSLKFEFPGGKIKKGETEQQAVVREVKEELEMDIYIERKLMTLDHQYPDIHISLHVFICGCENDKFTLTEHIEYEWLLLEELDQLDWASAEWKVVEKLKSWS